MNTNHNAEQRKPHLRRRVLGSILSAVAAWSVLTLLATVYGLAHALFHHPSGYLQFPWWVIPAILSTFAAGFVSAIWLLLLLPLYLLAPRHSPLWRWPICTLCGAIAGAAMKFAFYGLHDSLSTGGMLFIASLSGATTCLFGALISERFYRVSHSTNDA